MPQSEKMLALDTPIIELDGVGKRLYPRLKRLKIKTVRDLLWHFPVRYEDYSSLPALDNVQEDDTITAQGKVESISSRRISRGRTLVEATVTNDTGTIRAIWFNQPYIADQYPTGTQLQLSGKVSRDRKGLVLTHPIHEKMDNAEANNIHTGGLVPIYSETKGLTSHKLRELIYGTLENIDIAEWLPSKIQKKHNLPSAHVALHWIHFPEHSKQITQAKQRFALEDMLLLQLTYLLEKREAHNQKAPRIAMSSQQLKRILSKLPFTLTDSQHSALKDILQDINGPSPMARLLYGDVGSGKTVVALLAVLAATRNGYQSALMAPTSVLATQHFQTLRTLFNAIPEEYQPTSALLTSEEARIFYESDLEDISTRRDVREKTKDGRIDLLVGTHSLIQKSTKFKKLGLIIVDEQHRFGVAQRSALLRNDKQYVTRQKAVMPDEGLGTISNTQETAPHFLSMSATPIPRTFMLSLFGDLDISIIDELPAGRKRPYTKVVPPKKREAAYAFVKEKLSEGRQAFVICPRIESSGSKTTPTPSRSGQRWANVRAVEEEYQKLSKVFDKHNVAYLHGRMEAEEKQKIMEKMKRGDIDVLVSTSVIEVGIDIPNATVMIIEGAELFGLAQLYQFRGRIGRGEHQSFCFLFYDRATKEIERRLRAFVMSDSGFELAEKDLELRGPGELLGKAQSGVPDTIMQHLGDEKLVVQARKAAKQVLEEGNLAKTYPALYERLGRFRRSLTIA